MDSIAVIAFTERGLALAQELRRGLQACSGFEGAAITVAGPARFAGRADVDDYGSLAGWTQGHFERDDALVFVSAAGIAVRAIAPHVRDKFSDPAVVSVDEAGRFVVPLLSGHVGGANGLARAVAQVTGGQAAVSTATDVNGLFAVDEWAVRHGLAIVERAIAKEVSAALLAGQPVGYASDYDFGDDAPRGVVEGPADVGFCVSLDDSAQPFARTLHLVPRIATVGVGCRRGTDADVLADFVHEVLAEAHVSPHAVVALASIDVKADEPAILQLAGRNGWDARFYSAEELAAVPGQFAHSAFVERTVGVGNVCERAACAAGASLVLGKRSHEGVTVAIAAEEAPVGARLVFDKGAVRA